MRRTILAIDDDASMLKFYVVALGEFGDVRTATNLQEARKQLKGVDLILLDFYLEHDQYLFQDIVPELKKVAPVILCSGIQDAAIPGIGATLGIAGYWNKGSNHQELCSLVRSVLNSSKPASD